MLTAVQSAMQMITLVESVDGQQALLGRPKALNRSGVLTCLSGFMEQGESIEETVRREVMEEAGVPVGDVAVLGSQPWPIGDFPTCPVHQLHWDSGCIRGTLSTSMPSLWSKSASLSYSDLLSSERMELRFEKRVR